MIAKKKSLNALDVEAGRPSRRDSEIQVDEVERKDSAEVLEEQQQHGGPSVAIILPYIAGGVFLLMGVVAVGAYFAVRAKANSEVHAYNNKEEHHLSAEVQDRGNVPESGAKPPSRDKVDCGPHGGSPTRCGGFKSHTCICRETDGRRTCHESGAVLPMPACDCDGEKDCNPARGRKCQDNVVTTCNPQGTRCRKLVCVSTRTGWTTDRSYHNWEKPADQRCASWRMVNAPDKDGNGTACPLQSADTGNWYDAPAHPLKCVNQVFNDCVKKQKSEKLQHPDENGIKKPCVHDFSSPPGHKEVCEAKCPVIHADGTPVKNADGTPASMCHGMCGESVYVDEKGEVKHMLASAGGPAFAWVKENEK